MKKIIELAAAAFGREAAPKNIEYRYVFVPECGAATSVLRAE